MTILTDDAVRSNESLPEKSQGSEAGLGWVDHPDSPEARAGLVARVGEQQAKLAAGNPDLHGVVPRGQHQKQLLGAFATLTIPEGIPAAVRVGPFSDPGRFRSACRISNGQPCPHRDQAPDVRGIAIKFFTKDGVETDLVMTNEGGRSHARDAIQFMEVADILATSQVQGGAIEALRELTADVMTGKLGPAEAARVAFILGKETVLRKVASMATEHYWGSVVEAEGRALKYSLHPHPLTPPGTDGDPKDAEYLRTDLARRLQKEPLRFNLSVQLFIDERATPVNDASIAWEAPLVQVGELAIESLPSEADEDVIDHMAFNPGNGFAPLGMTHARKDVYAASAKNRGALTTAEIRGYFSDPA